jgi:hypothetical protein
LLLGFDSFEDLPLWRRHEDLLRALSCVYVVSRLEDGRRALGAQERARAANPNLAVVGAGDFIGATPLISALFFDEPAVETLNKIGMDFIGVGNHEFDKGKDELRRLQNGGCKFTNGVPDPNSCKGFGSAAPGRATGVGKSDERLLALLAVCRTPSDLELADAARAARLPATAVLSVQRALAYLGLPLHPPRQSGWHGEGALPEWSAVAGTPPPAVEPSPDLDRAAVERVVELRRHTPVLAPLLQHALGGTLPLDRYPFVDGDDAEEHVADPFERALASPRSELVGSWAFRRRSAAGGAVAGGAVSLLAGAQDGAGDKTRAPAAPPRLMVFMLGGASHAELRCAHEAGDEVGFGCTALLTPLQYVRALQQMGAAPMAPASDAAGLLSF